jgi:glycosyltransferase involved in cell wall biosynthesis
LRPEIPLLVVEGRRKVTALERVGLDLSGLQNLSIMANTPYPRDFYRVSRAILMPSLWQEPFGRVAAEALANGLPVLASNRGGLPEALGGAGWVFDLPERCTPSSGEVPTAAEVAPWLEVIERIWDDPAFEAEARARALAAARRWDPARMGAEYESYFRSCLSTARPPRAGTEDAAQTPARICGSTG